MSTFWVLNDQIIHHTHTHTHTHTHISLSKRVNNTTGPLQTSSCGHRLLNTGEEKDTEETTSIIYFWQTGAEEGKLHRYMQSKSQCR